MLVGELEDPFGARVDRRVHRVAEAGDLPAGIVHLPCDLERLAAEVRFEQPRALLRGAEDHRAAAEDPGRDGSLQRIRIRRKRHPRGDVRRHEPVLGDRHEQQVEEEALLLGRLLAREEQVEVLREREPAHEVAGQVAPAHLDAIGVGLADPSLHARIFLPMHPLATTVIGSYPQPDWLIDRQKLAGRLPPRVPAHELWRVDEAWLVEAQDDATRLAVRDMEEAGIDVVTDGEIRRESYSNYFANALEGLDLDEPGTALDRTGHPNPVPRVVGEIRRARPVQVRDAEFLRALTGRPIRVTVPGPFTMSQQAQNDHYPDLRSLALAYAAAVNEELRDLVAAGADVVQIDEPYLQARPDDAQVVRARGDRTRIRGRGRDEGAAHLLRLRGDRAREAERLSVPRGARRVPRGRDLDRSRPAAARSVAPRAAALEARDPRRPRPERHGGRERRGGRRSHPRSARAHRSGAPRWSVPTAA